MHCALADYWHVPLTHSFDVTSLSSEIKPTVYRKRTIINTEHLRSFFLSFLVSLSSVLNFFFLSLYIVIIFRTVAPLDIFGAKGQLSRRSPVTQIMKFKKK